MLKLFQLLTLFNWITPTKGFVEDTINDPSPLQSGSWTFFIPYNQAIEAGWNADAIDDLMERHGIHHWGGQYTFPQNEYLIRVKRGQAQWAEYVFLAHGVPLDERFPAPRGRQ